MNQVAWFLVGMCEYRQFFTSSAPLGCFMAYEYGREWAHRLTLRRFDAI